MGFSMVRHVVPRETRVQDEHGGARKRSVPGPAQAWASDSLTGFGHIPVASKEKHACKESKD